MTQGSWIILILLLVMLLSKGKFLVEGFENSNNSSKEKCTREMWLENKCLVDDKKEEGDEDKKEEGDEDKKEKEDDELEIERKYYQKPDPATDPLQANNFLRTFVQGMNV